jgi:methionine--tRNA ligase beta chain
MDNEITNQSNLISFEEFSKIDLRIGRITKIEYIPKLSKVYKEEVDLGFEKRVVVVGAAMYYKPNELEGRLVILCSKLLPKKIGDIESNGMILALDGISGLLIWHLFVYVYVSSVETEQHTYHAF